MNAHHLKMRAWAVTLMGIETIVYARTRAEAKAMVARMAHDAGYGASMFDMMRRCWALRAPELDDDAMPECGGDDALSV